MSKSTETNPTLAAVNAESEDQGETATKQSLGRRAINFVKTNKKPLIAAGGLLALVGGAGYLGRASAQYEIVQVPDDAVEIDVVEQVEETDTNA
jgi:hypothetical protein